MSLPELYELQHCLVHVADVVACAIIKRQQPAADLVTKRALYREFGRAGSISISPRMGRSRASDSERPRIHRSNTAARNSSPYSKPNACNAQKSSVNTDNKSRQNKLFCSLYHSKRTNTRRQPESR